ncbi:MAG: hypothetical protein GWN00_32305, partial [Aliifodinibius sp.]|nr:hypothetical protein [Fodinibius sp.]NIY29302.1 hypothetical protein [Fodinibius sp.]
MMNLSHLRWAKSHSWFIEGGLMTDGSLRFLDEYGDVQHFYRFEELREWAGY